MKTKKINPIFCVIFVLWLTGVVIATFFDLDISLAIADNESLLGRILEVAGEPPAILFTSFNFALISSYLLRFSKMRAVDIILAVLCAIGCVGTVIFTCIQTLDYISEYSGHLLHITYASIAAVIIIALFVMTAILMSEKSLKKYYSTACRCAIIGVATFVIIWLFKLIWGRVRFRQGGSEPNVFTPWYLPQGFNGYYSFPSGHTANATVIFSSVFYLEFLPDKYKKYKPLIVTLLALWIAFVAFSRVLVGAHFLSDVLFGAAITLAIIYFVKGKDKNVH